MDYTAVSTEEKNNQKKGAITSFVIHIALLILAVLPLLTFPDPPPGQSGVLVAFGDPELGQGEELGAPPPPVEEEVAEEEAQEPEEVEEPTPEPPKEKPKKETPKPTKKVNTDASSNEIALKKQKEEERKKAREAWLEKEAKRKKKEAEAAEAAKKKKLAEEKAKREAEAAAKKAADAEKWKNLGTIGSGGGNNDKPGSNGQLDGDPDGKALDGVSTGSGEIGGNLGGRDVTYKPRITDNSQKTGDVVVKVCVDANGKVTSAKYTQLGSTATDSNLINTAVKAARKYRFDKGTIDKQCGTIKIKFRLK
ncbi:MAG: energy transducer TonB [Bacteroidota bacterium]